MSIGNVAPIAVAGTANTANAARSRTRLTAKDEPESALAIGANKPPRCGRMSETASPETATTSSSHT